MHSGSGFQASLPLRESRKRHIEEDVSGRLSFPETGTHTLHHRKVPPCVGQLVACFTTKKSMAYYASGGVRCLIDVEVCDYLETVLVC